MIKGGVMSQTREEFVEFYIDGNSRLQQQYDNAEYVVMPCNCDVEEDDHWAWIKNDKPSIHHQLKFNTPNPTKTLT